MATSVVDLLLNTLNPQGEGYKPGGLALRCIRPKTYPAGSSAARSYPVSLVYSGNYNWRYGELDNEEKWGHWWSLYTYSDEGVMIMNTGWNGDTKYLNPQNSAYKEYGFSLRCVKLFIHQKYNICSKAHARHILTGLHNHTKPESPSCRLRGH